MLFRVSAPCPGERILIFELPRDHPGGHISVVGTFNDWTPGADLFHTVGDVQRVTVTVSACEEVLFRYLGEGGWWFDDMDADWIDDRGSHIAPEPAPVASPTPIGVSLRPRRAAGYVTLSAAQYAVEVAEKRRCKAEKAAKKDEKKAAKKARRKAAKAAQKLRDQATEAQNLARRARRDARDDQDDQDGQA